MDLDIIRGTVIVILASLLWCLTVVIKRLKRTNKCTVLQKCRRNGDGNSKSDNCNAKNDDGERRTCDRRQTRMVVGGRGDRNSINLSQMRKHRRDMKDKYYKNSEKLIFYCFYKGLNDRYYATLRQC